jgi:hypothetical protein
MNELRDNGATFLIALAIVGLILGEILLALRP